MRTFKVEYVEADRSWREDDHWVLIYPSGDADAYETKSEAVKDGRMMAKRIKPSELIVYTKDGRLSENNSYRFR